MMNKKGYFISVEGTDGSGKSTQVELLIEYFKASAKEFIYLREPGGTKISEQIREIILNSENVEMHKETEMFLYAAARAQLVNEVIQPALDEGKIVICDRFVDSSFAYQSFGRGIPYETVKAVNDIAVGGRMPDMTLLFDLSPADAAARRKARGEVGDRLENEGSDFHTAVYRGYKSLAERMPERIKVIDANRTIEEVHNDVISLIEELVQG